MKPGVQKLLMPVCTWAGPMVMPAHRKLGPGLRMKRSPPVQRRHRDPTKHGFFYLFALPLTHATGIHMSPQKFADKYLLAFEQAIKEKPSGGLHGFEQEWNLLDEDLRPLLTVGAGPSQQSFVDYLRAECLP